MKRWIWLPLTALLLVLTLGRINRILADKGTEYTYYSSSAQHRGFYRLKKNTADVLFLGSSHCYCAFNPQEFYDGCGIRSYNLGTSQQSIWLSYYWLKEALRRQHPKAVVLETFYLTNMPGGTGDEASYRKALDGMRLSPVKLEAVRAVCGMNIDPRLTPESFFFTNLRYHSRWSQLQREDFFEQEDGAKLKGYAPIAQAQPEEAFAPFSEQDFANAKEKAFDENVRLYLDRLRALCGREGITLILVKTPSTHWSAGEHVCVDAWAREGGTVFIDYNLPEEYERLGLDFEKDMYDYGHMNIFGSRKVAQDLGARLVNDFGVTPEKDPQWEETAGYWARLRETLTREAQ